MQTTWVKQLLKEYAKGKRMLEQYKATLTLKNPAEKTEEELQELSIVEEMISDLNYAMEWMRTGRRPGSRRGTDIKDAYSRAILMEMDLLPSVASTPEPEIAVTIEQKKAIVMVLMKLSPRERQCYLLHTAKGMSYAQISKEIKCSKRSVQEYIMRAKSKVGQAI